MIWTRYSNKMPLDHEGHFLRVELDKGGYVVQVKGRAAFGASLLSEGLGWPVAPQDGL